VGFSVDYVLHLANSYNVAADRKSGLRYCCMRSALTQTGTSVLAASITTLGASFFLFFCYIQVFVKIGIVIAANTFLSIFFALFFFAPLLMLCGPIGLQGSFAAVCLCFPCYRRRLAAHEGRKETPPVQERETRLSAFSFTPPVEHQQERETRLSAFSFTPSVELQRMNSLPRISNVNSRSGVSQL